MVIDHYIFKDPSSSLDSICISIVIPIANTYDSQYSNNPLLSCISK